MKRAGFNASAGAPLVLPASTRAALFDLDGVLTRTARLHASAWAATFDEFLVQHRPPGPDAGPFTDADYRAHVDGLPRLEGVRRFLESRHVILPEGDTGDGPDACTVVGLGARKNARFMRLLAAHGPDVIDESRLAVERLRSRGIACAVVSSSANAVAVLEAAEMSGMFDVVVDGGTRDREDLRGKPAPDTFEFAANALGVLASEACVFEDAESGVAAGRAGSFGLVVGIAEPGRAEALLAAGADVVVADLGGLATP